MDLQLPDRERITIAILALGGEGGGVLADWILEVAQANGYIAQGTSVPGVAQRTGSTVYYIEMVKRRGTGGNSPDPVLAMMPVPGDVDIVIASELMEAGRAILRGFVSKDRTTLIGSTHRVFAISEKAVPGDGRGASQRILAAAERGAARFISFDMAAAASTSSSVISSVMFGALAGSETLPFSREAFEAAIRHGGKAVESNLKGFGAGFDRSQNGDPVSIDAMALAEPTTAAGRALKDRIDRAFREPVRPVATTAVARLMDYQDAAYAHLYLERLEPIAGRDDGRDGDRLTKETARHLALWMAYEDTIRVADLKVRATRSARVATEVRLAPGQVMTVTEYMHPRLQEVCETLPAGVGGAILRSATLRRLLTPLFKKGRHVRTTSLRWFAVLRLLASLRRIRRSTLRYRDEQARIGSWLAAIDEAATRDVAFAIEIVLCQQLIKGYSDTFERGLERFNALMLAGRSLSPTGGAADDLRRLREAALADDSGKAFDRELVALNLAAVA